MELVVHSKHRAETLANLESTPFDLPFARRVRCSSLLACPFTAADVVTSRQISSLTLYWVILGHVVNQNQNIDYPFI